MITQTVDHGRYEIIRKIGSGGMGSVYQARQTSIKRMVALKIMRLNGLSGSAAEVTAARFVQEAQLFQKLRHPNTITVHDFGRTENGELFIAMELLSGESLSALMNREAPLSVARALHIMEQICNSVGEAHACGVIHRDLKPENIQIENVGGDPDFVKVLDFGIAKLIADGPDADVAGDASQEPVDSQQLTMAGEIFGTPHYMSPEQTHGLPVDNRTDIYSLGVILYEMLSGHLPFTGQTAMAIMMAHAAQPAPDIREQYPELNIPDAVAELILDCMEKRPEDRVQSIEDMRQRIQAAALQFSNEVAELYGAGAVARLIHQNTQNETTGERRLKVHTTGSFQAGDGALTTATIPPRGQQSKHFKKYGIWLLPIALVALLVGVFIAFSNDEPKPDLTPVSIAFNAGEVDYTLTSLPKGAEVYENERLLGVTPLQFSSPEGTPRSLLLRAEGYVDSVVSLTGAEKDADRILQISMMPQTITMAEYSWFLIDSEPAGADVDWDGNVIGTTPFEWRPPVGEAVSLRFMHEGFEDEVRKVKREAAGISPSRVSTVFKKAKKQPNKAPTKRPQKTNNKTPYEKL